MSVKPIVLAVFIAQAGFASATDLLDVYHAAQSQDAAFAASRSGYEAAKEKLPQGRALLLPSVNLTANSTANDVTTRYLGLTPFPSGASRYNSHGYGVTLVQPLFRQQNWVLYTEAELQVAQAEAQFKIAENDLILRVSRAYFDALIAQDTLNLALAQKVAISEQLEQAKRNFEVGAATITDIYEAQSRYALTDALEISARSSLEIKKRSLQQLTNRMPENLQSIGQEFRLVSPQPEDLEKWVADAQQHNLQLAAAKIGVEIAEKEVERNRGGHYPTVDIVASHQQNYANGGTFGVGSDMRTSAIGVQLNMPLFQGGAQQSKWREAEANRDRAKNELENTHRNIELQTRQAYWGIVNGMAQVDALQQALTSSESLLASSKLGQDAGVRTNLDVLNAQQQLYSTQRDLYQAKYNYLFSQLQLKAGVGILTEEDLAKINRALH